jgi:hypothetical protein
MIHDNIYSNISYIPKKYFINIQKFLLTWRYWNFKPVRVNNNNSKLNTKRFPQMIDEILKKEVTHSITLVKLYELFRGNLIIFSSKNLVIIWESLQSLSKIFESSI